MATYPTPTQVGNTESQIQGSTRVDQDQEGYLFASGVLMPEIDKYLSVRYPQYLATQIFSMVEEEPVAQSEYAWFELDRTRRAGTVTAGGGGTGATVTLTTDIEVTNTPNSDGYYIVGDTLITKGGIIVRVTAVGLSGNFQTITVAKQNGTSFANTDIVDNDKLGHIGSSLEEGSAARKARRALPLQRRNKTTILDRNIEVTGSALTAKTWLAEGAAWVYDDEDIQLGEFARDRENTFIWNESTPDGNTPISGSGVINTILDTNAQSTKNTYSGALSETDLQDHITQMKKLSGATTLIVLAGAEWMGDMQVALRDYTQAGALDYGVFSALGNVSGLNCVEYVFQGVRVQFYHYAPFDDVETVPEVTSAAGVIDYSNFSLWLTPKDMNGRNLLKMTYRSLNGEQRKFRYKVLEGMHGKTDSMNVGTLDDAFKSRAISEIGSKVCNLNSHGALYQQG